jgi:hypothetical protein
MLPNKSVEPTSNPAGAGFEVGSLTALGGQKTRISLQVHPSLARAI